MCTALTPRARCGGTHGAARRAAITGGDRDVSSADASSPLAGSLPTIEPDPTPPEPEPEPSRTRVIIAGGGSLPSLNQVSLAQDLALARRALTGPSLVLFASGPSSFAQVEVEGAEADPFAARLASLLDPRSGREARHVAAPVHAQRASSAEAVLSAVRATLARSTEPLLLYIAAHGTGGESPRDSVVGLWEDSELTVPDLVAALDDDPLAQRPVRVVITACFGGGFSELVFRDALARNGASRHHRCGLFATTFDRESSGCDPNPDRRAQGGFGLHFLHALRGEDRDGAPLDRSALDYDGDGGISLLDAHTRARIAGRSIDVPTTSSERWLREVVRGEVTQDVIRADPLVVEEDAVISALSQELGVPPTIRGAREALASIEAERRPLLERLDAIDQRDGALSRTLSALVLARYPVLDDPWHRDFAAQLAAARVTLPALLDEHPATIERASLARERATLAARDEPLEVRAALALRLIRAHETKSLAARLRARGGSALATFARLRACERSAP